MREDHPGAKDRHALQVGLAGRGSSLRAFLGTTKPPSQGDSALQPSTALPPPHFSRWVFCHALVFFYSGLLCTSPKAPRHFLIALSTVCVCNVLHLKHLPCLTPSVNLYLRTDSKEASPLPGVFLTFSGPPQGLPHSPLTCVSS